MSNSPRDILQKIAAKRAELAKYKNLLEVVDKCSLDHGLKTKVNNLVKSSEVGSSMKLTENENLLGLSLKPESLTIDEQRKLHRIVKSKLLEEPYLKHKEDVNAEDFDVTKPSKEESELLKLKVELDEVQKKYYKNLIDYQKMLEEILNNRLNKSEDLINDRIHYTKMDLLCFDLKVKILQEQIASSIFTEESMAKQAYQKLTNEISSQQIKVKNEIKELEELKEKYKLVESKEFNDILKSYRFYMGEVRKIEETLAKVDSVQ